MFFTYFYKTGGDAMPNVIDFQSTMVIIMERMGMKTRMIIMI